MHSRRRLDGYGGEHGVLHRQILQGAVGVPELSSRFLRADVMG
jgi:hypothetical protein